MSEISQWFANLSAIQSRVKQLNNETADDLYAFSHQRLALVKEDLQHQNLCQFCQQQTIGVCRADTFDDLTKTFRWFLDEISTPIAEILVWTCFAIARDSMVPPYTGTVAALRKQPVKNVCSTPVNQAILVGKLFPDIPVSFYAGKGDLMQKAIDTPWTIEQLCEEIVK